MIKAIQKDMNGQIKTTSMLLSEVIGGCSVPLATVDMTERSLDGLFGIKDERDSIKTTTYRGFSVEVGIKALKENQAYLVSVVRSFTRRNGHPAFVPKLVPLKVATS